MSKFEKLVHRFLLKPKDYTYNELLELLGGLGYREIQGSGSRVNFENEKLKHHIKLHKPHLGNILKRYQIDLIADELKAKNLL
jgi:hypothetical protein